MIESLSKGSDWSSSLSNIASGSLWSLFKKEEVLIETAPSLYRKVFQTTPEMKKEFSLFLQTIFYQLDEKKVFALMDAILQDEAKTDDMIYQELLEKIETTKKSFSFFSMIKALFVVRRGIGIQAAELLKPFDPTSLKGYLEIYNRRYAGSIQKYAGLSFKKTAALCDQVATTFKDRVEGGTFFYPYQKILPLNDSDCKDPSLEVEKTYQPMGSDIEDESIDLMGCLGGLHHVPEHRLDSFAQSMAKKLKPGGVCLLRDHNAGDEKIKAIASVVHSFVNAVDQVSLEKEVLEIRNFQSEEYWTHLMEKHGFSRIDKKSLVLKNDPTQNGMMAFVKKPKNKKEMEMAASFQKDYKKSPIGSYATWIEWGNVRYSKQYSKFIHQNHSYAFDFVGHISQHWTHFYYTVQQSLAHPMGKVKDVFLSDNGAMNLFIVLGTTIQLGFSAITSFPSVCFARWRYGKNWKDVVNLSAVEKEEAKFQEDYSTFIDYDPFFKYPYFKTIESIWKAVFYSKDSFVTKVMNIPSAISLTLPIGAQGLLSKFIESIYYSPEASSDQEVIQVMVQDPYNEIDTVIEKWNEEKLKTLFKGKMPYQNCEMKVIYSAPGQKLISIPFYKPFTQIVNLLSATKGISLLSVGGQEKITLDLLLSSNESTPSIFGSKLIYEMDRLQDPEKKRYATYEVKVEDLCRFCKNPKVQGHLEYIHAHR